jgi:hypothetical protein
MFSLFAFQIALTRIWVESLADANALFSFSHRHADRTAASNAMRELDEIVRVHADRFRQRAAND